MSFNIILQHNESERNRLGKTITEIVTLTGTLRQGTSIIDPAIIVETSADNIAQVNYLTIATFNRKYFVNDVVTEANGLYRLSCHVDVLESYGDAIKLLGAVIERQEENYNLLLDDGSFKAYQNPIVSTIMFPSGFSNPSYVIAVAGA